MSPARLTGVSPGGPMLVRIDGMDRMLMLKEETV